MSFVGPEEDVAVVLRKPVFTTQRGAVLQAGGSLTSTSPLTLGDSDLPWSPLTWAHDTGTALRPPDIKHSAVSTPQIKGSQ